MIKPILLCAAVLALPVASSVAVEMKPEAAGVRIDADGLRAIAGWLSSTYGLPPVDALPTITFVSSETMAALLRRRADSDHWSASLETTGDDVAAPDAPTVVAIYDDVSRTIICRRRGPPAHRPSCPYSSTRWSTTRRTWRA
jgi:hypothetical protein